MSEQTSSQPKVRPARLARSMSSLQRHANSIAIVLAMVWLLLIALTITPQVDDFKWY